MADDIMFDEEAATLPLGGIRRAPDVQAFIDLPITVVRGGIKYPASAEAQRRISKGTPVASTLNQKLAALKNKQENLAAEIANLERKVKAQRPAPPVNQSAWSIRVQFTPNGMVYTYLVLRSGGRYYTTGTKAEDGVFDSWDDLLDWLDAKAAHGPLIPLAIDVTVPNPLPGRA